MVMYDSKAPGVYIEEISGGARPIQAVGTSTAGFVGVAPHPKAPRGVAPHPEEPRGEAIAVNNWLEFVSRFRVDVAGELEAAENALKQAESAIKAALRKLKQAKDDKTKAEEELEKDPVAKQAALDAQRKAAAKAQEAKTALKEAKDKAQEAKTALKEAKDKAQETQTALKQAEVNTLKAQTALDQAKDTTLKAQTALDEADDSSKANAEKARDDAVKAEADAQKAHDDAIKAEAGAQKAHEDAITAEEEAAAALDEARRLLEDAQRTYDGAVKAKKEAEVPKPVRPAFHRQKAAQQAHKTAVAGERQARKTAREARDHKTAVEGAGGPGSALVQAVYGFFLNGGTRCYVANVRDDTLQEGLNWLALRDEVAIVAAPGYTDRGDYEAVLTHCENLKDRVAILDAPKQVDDTGDLIDIALSRPRSSSYGTFYYPWIKVYDPLDNSPDPDPVAVPPSGHIAGVWARTDAERGVHKAPANTPIRGALELVDEVADDEQGVLNQRGVNCIRLFSSDGILVWGARTLSSDQEWRYLNVRRLLNMIEESIEESTRWAVFEPNDAPLWAALRRDVSAFLTRIWRTGALRGTTPEQAFFVKCDEETNPPENIDAGIVTTVIGVAPVKPAEFVVFQIRQYQPGSEVETQGG